MSYEFYEKQTITNVLINCSQIVPQKKNSFQIVKYIQLKVKSTKKKSTETLIYFFWTEKH
jgi:hypothetical protein